MRKEIVLCMLVLVLIFPECKQDTRESYDPVVTDTGLLIMSQQYPYRISAPSYIDDSDRYYVPEDLRPDYLYDRHHNRYYNEYEFWMNRGRARYGYSDYRYRDYRHKPYRYKRQRYRHQYHRHSHQRYYDHEDTVSESYDPIPLPEVRE